MDISFIKEPASKGWTWFVEYAKNHKWKTLALLEALWIGVTS